MTFGPKLSSRAVNAPWSGAPLSSFAVTVKTAFSPHLYTASGRSVLTSNTIAAWAMPAANAMAAAMFRLFFFIVMLLYYATIIPYRPRSVRHHGA